MVFMKKIIGSLGIAESPHWDIKSQSLYYVDKLEQAVHRYDPAKNQDYKSTSGNRVTFIIPLQNTSNKFLIGQNRTVAIFEWDGLSKTIFPIEEVAEFDITAPNNKLNDGKCDSFGQLWTGTIGPITADGRIGVNKGAMYSLGSDRNPKMHITDVGVSNGITWNLDYTKMYYIDSTTREIHQYDFDINSKTVNNKKVIFRLDTFDIPGIPDGQTTDSDGNLWVAIFNGSRLIQIDPRENDKLLRTVMMPTRQVTSCAFGGPNLDELYVTTGRFALGNEELDSSVEGALYQIKGLKVKGLPAFDAKF